ncbi:DUF397 domain-containing protein [Actinomadura livida]|uniref:DUF397 domain-containing protein n=1 Tax=Actinomadura livida TaxID=79909 RepID=A0A7W7MWU4_9ACTN|nr:MULTISPECIES: DUF397 domain-containing protein [Actinomadura]MBB4773978.1 hypothetical protein [Actinomadura catellatispora]GGT85762.1 hypothetical protein GCM10010208_05830 [Actinomadura livida]
MSRPELIQPTWRKSSHSGGNEGNCVEIAILNDHVGVRDSKAPETGHLNLTRQHFAALLTHLRAQA